MSDEEKYEQFKTLMNCRADIADPEKYIKELEDLIKNFESTPEINKIIKINKALSEKKRLIILELLRKKEDMCICELTDAWAFKNLSQPTISHHIQKLEAAGLIEGRKSGKFIYYRLKEADIQNYLELIQKFLIK